MVRPATSRRAAWTADVARRYPPLITVVVALLVVIFALPSALNLPQANPGQTLEYAPVPGNGTSAPGGNIAGLGLGQASGPGGAGGSGSGGPSLTQPLPSGISDRPSQYQCVGNPPRQTEDPLSPPCVAFYNGNNGGATYQGVSATEIRVIVYGVGGAGVTPTSKGEEKTPTNTYIDLWQPPSSNEDVYARGVRIWQTYFNNRYQFYGRKLHVWMYDNSGATDPTTQQADASMNYQDKHPFAVFTAALQGKEGAYAQAMEQHGVLFFGGLTLPQLASSFSQYPGLSWDFLSSFDQEAMTFATYVCTKLKPYPVSFSGPAFLKTPRVYGFLYADDPTEPYFKTFAMEVKALVEGCGITFKDQASDPYATYIGSNPSYASQNMAKFSSQGITTIIWPGGWDSYNSQAAASLNYFPEWVLAGDTTMESQFEGQLENQTEWADAMVVTPMVRYDPLGVEQGCEEAYRSLVASVSADDMKVACGFYDDMRLMATAIQSSGPKLTPGQVKQGLLAIPPHSSSSPDVPACYFVQGDYTCTKDAMAEWWDRTAATTNGQGCWRMIQGGLRYRAGGWPAGDAGASRNQSSDACNTYDLN